MDELLDLWDDSVKENIDDDSESYEYPAAASSSNGMAGPSTAHTSPTLSTRTKKTNAVVTPSEKLALSVDDRIGIRMINRTMAGVDLFGLITDNPFHSTSQLCAYSLAQLNNTILLDPAAVVDAATVNGRTNMVSVGLVFSNTGTRVSGAGNAFCVITIGTLQTGPTVSVMLFGTAYQKLCRACTPGKVVALVGTSLLSPSNKSSGKSNTSITFAASNDSQCVLVADARDFGTCKGMVRSKNENGAWINNGKPCRHYVDKRVGEYCHKHRGGGGGGGNNSGIRPQQVSGIQQLRIQARAFPTAHGNRVPGPQMEQQQQQRPVNSRFEGSKLNTSTLMAQIQMSRPRTGSKMNAVKGNSLLNPPQVANQQLQQQSAIIKNPYQNHVRNSVSMTRPTVLPPVQRRRTNSDVMVRPVTRDILAMRKRKTSNAVPARGCVGGKSSKSRRGVNTDIAGFNGSVVIPQPSALFSRAPVAFQQQLARVNVSQSQHLDRSHEDIVAKQRELASARMRQGSQASTKSLSLTNKKSMGLKHHKSVSSKGQQRIAPRKTAAEMLFASLDPKAVKAAASSRSRFADEALAEDYARSRKVVSELEENEDKRNRTEEKKKKSGLDGTLGTITKEWKCQTCNRSFNIKPVGCLRLQHIVKTMRAIKKSTTKTQDRQRLTDKAAANGGLKLGSGLDWSNKWE